MVFLVYNWFVLAMVAALLSCRPIDQTSGPMSAVQAGNHAANQAGNQTDKTNFSTWTTDERFELRQIKAKVDHLQQKLVRFWFSVGPDQDHGGFFGAHDIDGVPVPKADKGLVNQSRHLWYLANTYQYGDQSSQIKAYADSLFKFITTSKLYDANTQEFHFRVDYLGQNITDARQQFYANSFAIYGLANYGLVFNSAPAKSFALNAYRSMVRRGWDSQEGGFNQKGDPWSFSDPRAEKDYNSHLHIMEAITSLYLVTGDSDAKAKLQSFIEVFVDKMIADRSYIPLEYKLDWTPAGELKVSFGHDLETVWLLLETANALDLKNSDPVCFQRLVTKIKSVGEYSAEKGFDAVNGGYFESGAANGEVKSRLKVWWVQAEAVSGLWHLFIITGDQKYLDRINNTLDFIIDHLLAPSGEWYWQVEADGKPNKEFNFLSGEWKSSYHNGRALLNLSRWISEIEQTP